MPPAILLLCDEPLWARSAKEILESRGFTLNAPVLLQSHPLDLLRANSWDICLLSLCQRHWDGIEILKVARVEFPGRKILYFYSDFNTMESSLAIQMGAIQALPKSLSELEFIEAVTEGAREGVRLRSHVPKGGEDLVYKGSRPRIVFSAREKQVLALISQGLTYRQISGLTNLSLSTVNTYRRRLIEKIGAKSGRELLLFALKSSVIVQDDLK